MKLKLKTDLLGCFFHTFEPESVAGKTKRELLWQGLVIGSPYPGYYLVQLFDWFVGERSCLRLVKIDDMASWQFYTSAEEMKETALRLRK